MDATDRRAATTYRWDLVRGGFQGVLETVFHSFVLLVAIQVFAAADGGLIKPTLAGGVSLGLLANPLTVTWVARRALPVNAVCALLWVGSALCLYLAALAGSLFHFFFAAWFAQLSIGQLPPLTTHIYTHNYPPGERGSRVSTAILLAGLTASCTALFGGWLLEGEGNLGRWRFLFVLASWAALVCAFALFRMPSNALDPAEQGNPWQNVRLIWRDPLFGLMCLAWMFLGIGNLMTLPMRVEYLVSPRYGIGASPLQFAIVIAFVPDVTRLLFTKMWGFLFDRLNFVVLRLVLNALFFASILIFFNATHIGALVVSAFFLGLAFSGGRIAWQLWVTKVAPDNRVAAYMSVHSALTGLRGSLSPFLGYAVLLAYGPVFVGWVGCGLIALSTGLFLPLRPAVEERRRRGMGSGR